MRLVCTERSELRGHQISTSSVGVITSASGGSDMAELYRYAAFISYSSKDAAFAKRLHGAIETYAIPRSLGAFDLIGEGKPNRVYPVFRDREELSAGGLSERIEAALKASARLIVVCSPNSAASPWVEKEILYFAGLGRGDRIFAVIPADAPEHDEAGADATPLCFPAALSAGGAAGAAEPLAADARKGRDGFRNACLKLVAGLIGVTPGQLIDRDSGRRRRQAGAAALSLAAAVVLTAFALDWASTRTWRAAFSTEAERLTGEGRPLAAMPFALAGAGHSGAVIPARSAGADAVLARVGAAPLRAHLGDLGPMVDLRASDDGTAVVGRGFDDQWIAINVAEDTRTPFAPLGAGQLSHGGGYLLFSEADGTLAAYDLERGGERIAIGLRYDIEWVRRYHIDTGRTRVVVLREDGRTLLVRLPSLQVTELGVWAELEAPANGGDFALGDRSGQWVLFDSSGARTPLGQLRNGRGRYGDAQAIVGQRPNGRWAHIDLGTFAETDLGALGSTSSTSPGRARVLVQHSDAQMGSLYAQSGRVFDVASRRWTELGVFMDLWMSTDDGILLGETLDGRLQFMDLENAPLWRGLNVAGPFREGVLRRDVAASADGRVIVAVNAAREAAVVDLRAGAARTLGTLGRVRTISLNEAGDTLLVQNEDHSVSLRDVSRAAWTGDARGGALARAVCGASADQMAPLPDALREAAAGTGGADAALAAAARGRPWNPCDWRGLAAGPEGWAQWWRRMSLRWGLPGAGDYACGEINAAGTTSPTRLMACARMRRQPEQGEPIASELEVIQ